MMVNYRVSQEIWLVVWMYRISTKRLYGTTMTHNIQRGRRREGYVLFVFFPLVVFWFVFFSFSFLFTLLLLIGQIRPIGCLLSFTFSLMLHNSTKKFVWNPDPMSYDIALHLSLEGLEETRASMNLVRWAWMDTGTFSALFMVREMERWVFFSGDDEIKRSINWWIKKPKTGRQAQPDKYERLIKHIQKSNLFHYLYPVSSMKSDLTQIYESKIFSIHTWKG